MTVVTVDEHPVEELTPGQAPVLAVSIAEAARILGIHKQTAYEMAWNGELPSLLLGVSQGRRVVPLDALREYLRRKQQEAAQGAKAPGYSRRAAQEPRID